MDPTEALIELFSAFERLEEAHFDDDAPAGEEAVAARADVLGGFEQLREWLEDLNGAPPRISEIVLKGKSRAVGG